MSSVESTQAILLLLMALALLFAAHPAQAQTETVLYNFTGGRDGNDPFSGLTSDGAGNFYGTTVLVNGQSGDGTVFELSPNGSGGWNEPTIYTFPGGLSGFSPYGNVILDSAGSLYGTLYCGGAYNFGVVLELSRVGTSWTETVLYSFAGGTDGATPVSGLIMDPAGNLYGTTRSGGSNSVGTVFELSKSGGGWTERVIYSPAHKFNSSNYTPALTMDAAGNIFGASYTTVFRLSPNGHGGWNPTALHTFPGSYFADSTPVLDQVGNVYGTTYNGGVYNAGTVSMPSLGKTGTWTSMTLHAFGSGQDGAYSFGGVVLDAARNIYGTTLCGGQFDAGTVFASLAQVRIGSYKEKVLWSFNSTDGFAPSGRLILDSAGNLYGTTDGGGNGYPFRYGYGVAFELTP